MRLRATATDFIELFNLKDLVAIGGYLKDTKCRYFVLGGGSNVLLPEIYNGLVIHNSLNGVDKIAEDEDYVIVEAMAGEIWDEFVSYTLANDWFGLENLSLIPGSVGAAPIQNIGAYGAEVGDFIEYVKIFDIVDQSFKQLKPQDCNFSYRNSVFKVKHNYIVIAVGFKLLKKANLNIKYADIAQYIKNTTEATALDLRNCIIKIRQAKLPDPKFIGNVGSFFHNPIITRQDVLFLKQRYEDLPVYDIDDKFVKISAGWLIDKLGLKGYQKNSISVYEKQALVFINNGESTQTEVLTFAKFIQDMVKSTYNIDLTIEPIIVSKD